MSALRLAVIFLLIFNIHLDFFLINCTSFMINEPSETFHHFCVISERKKNLKEQKNMKKYGTEMFLMVKEIKKIDIRRGENGRICVLRKKKANNVKWKS